jgi:hypothetical protein
LVVNLHVKSMRVPKFEIIATLMLSHASEQLVYPEATKSRGLTEKVFVSV